MIPAMGSNFALRNDVKRWDQYLYKEGKHTETAGTRSGRRGGGVRIKRILSQIRRDFRAIYECEHCGYTEEGYGYDDRNFHDTVVPGMVCRNCGKKASSDYRPLTTKYKDTDIV